MMSSRYRGGEAGLTLVEMIVVLAIIGVMSGMVLLAMGNLGTGGSVESEARRLAARLRFASDETMVTDRGLALSADSSGYRFVVRDPASDEWRPDEVPELGDRHALPRGMALNTDEGGRPQLVGADAGTAPMRATLSDGRSTWTVRFDGTDTRVEAGG